MSQNRFSSNLTTRIGLIMVVLVGLLSSSVYSSDSDTFVTRDNGFKRWQLSFSTGSYFIPLTYYGYDLMITLQYRLSPKHGIRFGVRSDFRNSWSKGEASGDDLWSSYYRADTLTDNFALVAYYIKYFRPRERVDPYLGLGPLMWFSEQDELRHSNTYDISYNLFESEYWKSYSFGIATVCGVEYSINGFLKLSAEYAVNLRYGYYSRHEHSSRLYFWSNTEEYSGKYFIIEYDYVRTGISLCF